MYELERKAGDYREVSAPAGPNNGTAPASDISAPFELWLNSVKAGSPFQDGNSAGPLALPCIDETPRRAETPPPSAVPAEYADGFELRFQGTLHIDGYFTGKVRSDQGTLVLGKDGEINTDIAVGVAVIHGTVVGNIKARKRIELGSAARVIGDLDTPALVVMPGAIFEGKCYSCEATRHRKVHGNAGPDQVKAQRGKSNGKKARARKPDWRRS